MFTVHMAILKNAAGDSLHNTIRIRYEQNFTSVAGVAQTFAQAAHYAVRPMRDELENLKTALAESAEKSQRGELVLGAHNIAGVDVFVRELIDPEGGEAPYVPREDVVRLGLYRKYRVYDSGREVRETCFVLIPSKDSAARHCIESSASRGNMEASFKPNGTGHNFKVIRTRDKSEVAEECYILMPELRRADAQLLFSYGQAVGNDVLRGEIGELLTSIYGTNLYIL